MLSRADLNTLRLDYGRMRGDYSASVTVRDFVKAFGHAVMEGTMALSEGGNGPAERGVGIVVLIIVTL